MGVQQSLLDAFASANVSSASGTRFLKVTIENEQAVLALSVPSRGSADADFALVEEKAELKTNEAAYIIFKLDGSGGWCFITFVPDNAKVREKMLYSSSKGRLMKALGDQNFTDTIHATTLSELSPRGYAAHLAANRAPAPLTERERALQEVRAAEQEAAKEAGLAMEGTRARGGPMGAMAGVGSGLEWGEGVEAALKGLASPTAANGEGKFVGLTLDPKKVTNLVLAMSSTTTLANLHTLLPAASPQYTFFSFSPSSAGVDTAPLVIFIYTCPPKSPIKSRMIYSSSVSSLISRVKDQLGISIAKKFETSEPSTLTSSEILSELGSLATSSGPRQPVRANTLAPTGSSPISETPVRANSNPSTPGASTPTSSSAPLDMPDEGKSSTGFAKPRGPPRRAALGGRVAAASRAYEASQGISRD